MGRKRIFVINLFLVDTIVIKYLIKPSKLIKIKFFKLFIRKFETYFLTIEPMFLSINNLNEGSLEENRPETRRRELYEGENPKSTNKNWGASKCCSHVNSNWQKLRK